MARTYELHFQEGFTGEKVEVLVDGTEIAVIEAKTRLQTGLAHIERVDLEPGQEVEVRIKDLNVAKSFSAFSAEDPRVYVRISLVENALVVDPTDLLPGYL